MAKKAMKNGVVDPTPNLPARELVARAVGAGLDTVVGREAFANWLWLLWQALRPVDGLRHFFMSETWGGDRTFNTQASFRRWLADELACNVDKLKEYMELSARLFGQSDEHTVRFAFTVDAVINYTRHHGWLFTWSKKLSAWSKVDSVRIPNSMELALEALDAICDEVRLSDYKEVEREYHRIFYPPKAKDADKDDTPTNKASDVVYAQDIKGLVDAGIRFTESDALQVIGTLSADDKASLFARIIEAEMANNTAEISAE